MVLVVIVEKTGVLKELNLKDFNIENLYKKAGFKTEKGFEEQTTWKINKECNIVLYGKCDGRAGQENKYDFPPPVDNSLFFGSCVLIHKNKSNDIVDLNIPLWKIIYEKLFGGFEDIGSEDSEEEEEDEAVENKTKQGYSKDDGFVVDDDEEDDEEEDEEDDDNEEENDDDDEEEFDDDDDDDADEEDEEDDEEVIKPRVQPKREAKKNKKIDNVFISMQNVQDEFMNCDSELSEEEYI
jgi:hypothetical protein